jgi:hypothetical protein
MGLFSLFSRKRDPAHGAAQAQVRGWARDMLRLQDGDALTVSQIDCDDGLCPGAETVLLIMRKGQRTQAVKIPKFLVDVSEDDVHEALVAHGA